MCTIPDELNVSINKLTRLLQLSLNTASQENTKAISSGIVELIAHTTQLSMTTTTLLNDLKMREMNLSACLNEMKDLVRVQQKKLQLVRSPSNKVDVATSTDSFKCSACTMSTVEATVLKKDIHNLNQTIDVLHSKLVQSKCLLQAQQIVIEKYDVSEKYNAREDEPIVSVVKKEIGDVMVSKLEPWGDLFANKLVPKHSTPLLASQRGMPPKQPCNRYKLSMERDDLDESSIDRLREGTLVTQDPVVEIESDFRTESDSNFEDRCWNEDNRDAYSHEFYQLHEVDSQVDFLDECGEEGVELNEQAQDSYDYDENTFYYSEQEHNSAQETVSDDFPQRPEENLLSEEEYPHESSDSLLRSRVDESSLSCSDDRIEQTLQNEQASGRWNDFHDGGVEDSFSLIQNFYETGS